MQVIFEPAAEADLAEARVWYASQRDGLDVALMRRVDETLSRISNAPHSYPVVYRRLRRAALRQFPMALFYKLVQGDIRVFAVYHSRRDPRRLKSRMRL